LLLLVLELLHAALSRFLLCALENDLLDVEGGTEGECLSGYI